MLRNLWLSGILALPLLAATGLTLAEDHDRDRRDGDPAILRAVQTLQTSVNALQASLSALQATVSTLTPPVPLNLRSTAPYPIDGRLDNLEVRIVNVSSVPHTVIYGYTDETGGYSTSTASIAPGETLGGGGSSTGRAGTYHATFIVTDGTRDDIRGSLIVRAGSDFAIKAVLSAD